MGSGADRQNGEASVDFFTLPQLAEITGIDSRTLHNWLKRGLLEPSGQKANGSGTTNLFDEEDAFQLYVLAELRQAGVEMQVLERAARTLRALVPGLNDGELLIFADEVRVLADAGDIGEHLPESAPFFVYPTERAWTALRNLRATARVV